MDKIEKILHQVSKIQIAENQLKTAINLFFNNGDPVSIHTLACASQEIIEVLGKKKGIKSMRVKAIEVIKEDKRKEFIKSLNRAKNSFKHADKDHDKTTEFAPDYTEAVLWDAARLYYFITKNKVPQFIAYDIWAYSKYPGFYILTEPEKAFYKEALGDFTYQDKLYFLNMIQELEYPLPKMIKPDDKLIHFFNKDFESPIVQFTKETKVYSVYYTLNNPSIETEGEGLIFNFYLNKIWTEEVSAEKVAHTILNSTKNIIGKPFQAPDKVTGKPVFVIFLFNEDGNLFITKISSIGDSAYSVGFSKKFRGPKLENIIGKWLANDINMNNSAAKELIEIGMDISWLNYLRGLKFQDSIIV